MKKILLVLSTELSIYQMLTFLEQNQIKYEIDLLVEVNEKNIKNKKSLKYIKNISRKSFFIKSVSKPIFFNIYKFWNIFFSYKNKIVYKKIFNLLKKKKFNLIDYETVYFSNESISTYILYKSGVKKFFFDHSPIDILLNKKLNLIGRLNNKVNSFINNKYMNIYYKADDNFSQKSIYANFCIKKNLSTLLSIKIFKKIFFKLNKNKNARYKYNYNLINCYAPYNAFSSRYTSSILKDYMDFFTEKIINQIVIKMQHKDILLLKFKKHIPIEFQLSILKNVKKKFPNRKFKLANIEFARMQNLEQIFSNLNIKMFFTHYSSSIYLCKIISPKTLIYSYGDYWGNFLNKNWKFFKNKNNYNNFILASKLFKKISKKL